MAKAPADLRSLARAHTELGIETLAGIASDFDRAASFELKPLAGTLSGPDFCFIFAPCGYDEPEILPP